MVAIAARVGIVGGKATADRAACSCAAEGLMVEQLPPTPSLCCEGRLFSSFVNRAIDASVSASGGDAIAREPDTSTAGAGKVSPAYRKNTGAEATPLAAASLPGAVLV